MLTRREAESLVIDGPARVSIFRIRGRQVQLAIEASPDVRIVREEIQDRPPAEHRRGCPCHDCRCERGE